MSRTPGIATVQDGSAFAKAIADTVKQVLAWRSNKFSAYRQSAGAASRDVLEHAWPLVRGSPSPSPLPVLQQRFPSHLGRFFQSQKLKKCRSDIRQDAVTDQVSVCVIAHVQQVNKIGSVRRVR